MLLDGNILKSDEKAVFSLRSLYRKYGYLRYKMSKFEEYDMYVRNKDFLISDNMITFTDANGKLLALKPDVTLSIIKNSGDSDGKLEKYYYNENVYRVAKGTHSFKEIMQTGLECIGNIDVYNMCEVVMLAAESLRQVSESYVLDVSHMGIISKLVDSLPCTGEIKSKIVRCIGEKNTHEIRSICRESGIDEARTEKILLLVTTYGRADKVLEKLKKELSGDGVEEYLYELEQVCAAAAENDSTDKINIDFSIVNDMSYYSGIVFRGFIEGIASGILSGGRYDKLMSRMGKKSGAIGFAVYLDLLERFNESDTEYDVDTVLLYDDSSSADSVSKAVKEIVQLGFSVVAERKIPEKLEYRRILQLRNGGVVEIER